MLSSTLLPSHSAACLVGQPVHGSSNCHHPLFNRQNLSACNMETWVILAFLSAKTLWVASNIQITQTGSSKNKQTSHQALVSTFRLCSELLLGKISPTQSSQRGSYHGQKLEAETPGLFLQLLILEGRVRSCSQASLALLGSCGHPWNNYHGREMLWLARSESYVSPLHWGRVTYRSTRNENWGGWQDTVIS